MLRKEEVTFRKRTRASAARYREARKRTPWGVHSNYRLVDPYPVYVKKASGSRIWDADANEYIDFQMAFGALVSGHSHPELVRAVGEQIKRGTIYGFEWEGTAKLANLICRRFGLNRVKFSTTGLEATMHAVRLARAYTSREKILKFEGCYHGSHDALLVGVKPSKDKAGSASAPNQVPASLGIPDEVIRNTLVAPFNELEAVRSIVERNGDELAGIILEPIPMNMGFVPPKKGFLSGLLRLCREHGMVLIFDEVKTCGKFYNGAAGVFGVQPDLMVLGKAIAGGYPLSVLGGRAEIMEAIVPGKVAHAGTFNSNPVCMTAGIVTLTKVLTANAMDHAASLGETLARGYRDIIGDTGLEARVQWKGLSGTVHFTDGEVANWRDFLRCNIGRWWAYYIMMLNRGIIPMATGPDEQWTVSVQHTKEDISRHLEVFEEVAKQLREKQPPMALVEAL
jgi:glutamate-1-semialdehyde 2,1-aminomutase